MNEKLHFLRQRIEHEDNLINQRLSALVGSQAFLLTAFAISLNAPKEFFSPHYEPVHRTLTHMLPVAGIASVAVLFLTMLGAIVALHGLRKLADRLATPEDPPVHSSTFVRWLGQAGVVGVPMIFLVLWIALLVVLNQK
jgi:NhaP-type Na+/H+ or K+/H+ antiporter